MDREAARVRVAREAVLLEWAMNNAQRDELVRDAVRDGVPKQRVHVITGLSRTTIDRIVRSEKAP